MRTRVGGPDVLTTPPNSQGITSLVMPDRMAGLDAGGPGTTGYVNDFVAAKRHAFGLRDRHVTDPAYMTVEFDDLLAGSVPCAEPVVPPAGGDTVYVCTVECRETHAP